MLDGFNSQKSVQGREGGKWKGEEKREGEGKAEGEQKAAETFPFRIVGVLCSLERASEPWEREGTTLVFFTTESSSMLQLCPGLQFPRPSELHGGRDGSFTPLESPMSLELPVGSCEGFLESWPSEGSGNFVLCHCNFSSI